MGEDSMEPTKNINKVLQHGTLIVTLWNDDESTGEDLGISDYVRCPVEGVAAVVDGAATLGLVMDGA